MLKHQAVYLLLIGFAAIMIVLLMLDDPAAKREELLTISATQQNQQTVYFFPEISSSTQVDGIEVLDNSTGESILLVKQAGLWYAPELPVTQTGEVSEAKLASPTIDVKLFSFTLPPLIRVTQAEVPPSGIDQDQVNIAASAFRRMGSSQQFDASLENLQQYGLNPAAYRVRFSIRDVDGNQYGSPIITIGDKNPENTAYYVWLEGDQVVYLIDSRIVEPILSMLAEPFQTAPEALAPSTEPER
ncbi:MAG: DUF4340 domain-containing protein [Chloroflexi bacterium]|nr:DUF4340 domain-containing protein [Chloroflexota bacterium]